MARYLDIKNRPAFHQKRGLPAKIWLEPRVRIILWSFLAATCALALTGFLLSAV